MGKQLSIYLNETATERLVERAIRECRRPNDQARYIILSALGLVTDDIPRAENSKSASVKVSETQTSAFATVNR